MHLWIQPLELQPCRHDLTGFCEKVSWRNAAELQSETTVPYIVRTSVARRIQLGAVRLLQTKIAEASDGIMAKLQYPTSHRSCTAGSIASQASRFCSVIPRGQGRRHRTANAGIRARGTRER